MPLGWDDFDATCKTSWLRSQGTWKYLVNIDENAFRKCIEGILEQYAIDPLYYHTSLTVNSEGKAFVWQMREQKLEMDFHMCNKCLTSLLTNLAYRPRLLASSPTTLPAFTNLAYQPAPTSLTSLHQPCLPAFSPTSSISEF